MLVKLDHFPKYSGWTFQKIFELLETTTLGNVNLRIHPWKETFDKGNFKKKETCFMKMRVFQHCFWREFMGFSASSPSSLVVLFVVLLPPRLEPPLHHLTCGVPNFGDAKCEGKRVVNTFVGRSRLQNVQKYPYHYGFMVGFCWVLRGEIQVRFLKVSEGKEWCTSSRFHLRKRTRKIKDLLGKRHLHFMLAPV